MSILDRLGLLDGAGSPAERQEVADRISDLAVNDVRYLVTLLWNVHQLRNAAVWALRELKEMHGECLGCPVCDCAWNLEHNLIATRALVPWPRQPDLVASLKRGDNLLSF